MAQRQQRGLLALGLLAVAALQLLSPGFVAPSQQRRLTVLPRAAFESGKVNKGAELGDVTSLPPEPVLECDSSCVSAIEDCLEEGCSVDALMKLDAKLAEDEQKIETAMTELQQTRKTNPAPGAETELAWLDNFLSRSGTLRAQLLALRPVDDTSFAEKIIRAASVAFGGGRATDYPKAGVSPFSA
mmetsp:Transcript_64661/g.145848  ORF Transcript_64661/g.145848 Transcript_64661/m.145848 type:complete len:186 (+) Transcript_64661:56-613(+)